MISLPAGLFAATAVAIVFGSLAWWMSTWRWPDNFDEEAEEARIRRASEARIDEELRRRALARKAADGGGET